jgi:glycosyltransferase A (GT-A) superfamily protein (DUF2064 family)
MKRFLVLFAREPARQAREKGLGSAAAADLFRGFAAGWLEAARQAGARLVVATPPEDVAGWRRFLSDPPVPIWIRQRGGSFGLRLEDAARQAAALGGHSVLVGGDVAPSASALSEAFGALEDGAEAALSPAPDGGVSLLALSPADLDLLRGIRERRRTVLAELVSALGLRGRRVSIVPPAADVDDRAALRELLREKQLPVSLVPAARRALAPAIFFGPRSDHRPAAGTLHGPPVLRGPPPPSPA